jgi:altronate dehydratase
MAMNLKGSSFEGWRRENGRMGVRNHVIILPVDDLSNAAAEAVANNIKGAMAIPHAYGRLQFGADLELHFRTIIGTGANPNVAAVIVIGIEPGWTGASSRASPPRASRSRLRHRAERRPQHHHEASRAAYRMVKHASKLRKVKAPLQELWVDQVRRERHHLGLAPAHRRQRLRQAVGGRPHAGLRRNHRADRRRAPGGRALQDARDREQFMRCSTATSA